MDDATLIAQVDANLVAFARHLGLSTPGGGVDERDDVLLIAGDDPTPVIVNSVFTTLPDVEPGAILSAAATFFGSRGHGYSVWTRAHADGALEAVLPTAGFRCVVDLPVMVLEAPPDERPAPAGSEIRAVEDEAGVEDFRMADRAGFADHDVERAAVDSAFRDAASLLHPDVAAFVAYVDGVPAAAAMSFTSLGVARIAWVGTVPAYRRRGLGDAVTRAAVRAGFARGATIAALESSPAGFDLYRSIGFRQVTTYRVWIIE